MKHRAQTQYFIRITVPTILISFFLVVLTQIAFAQTSPTRSIVISPPNIEYTLDPGETTEGVLKVTNNGDTELTFSATVHDFIVEDKNGTPKILSDDTLSNKYSSASWIGISPNTFSVPPHETKSISYFLQVPADAAPGGRYAAVVYEPIDIIQVQGTGAGVNTQLGSLFYITVAGPVTEKAEIVDFSAPSFSEYPPVSITTEIASHSDLHIHPSGAIIVKNIFGQEIARSEIAARNIFPEASLIYNNSIFEDSGFKIGRYTAELELVYGRDNNIPLTASTSFIVFPWRAAAVVGLVIAIIVVGFLLLRRKKDKKQTSTNSDQPTTPLPPANK